MAAYFRSTVRQFLGTETAQILGELNLKSRDFSTLRATTVISWERTISVLKSTLKQLSSEFRNTSEWGLLLEYEIPRRDRRIDVVLLSGKLVFVLEFKTGDSDNETNACNQAEHYALDLRDFHRESDGLSIIPICISRSAAAFTAPIFEANSDPVQPVLIANDESLANAISYAVKKNSEASTGKQIDVQVWDQSAYQPVPNIVEAAQMLFAGQSVRELSHAGADVHNLTTTTDLLVAAIGRAQREQRKIICFVTGVPGAGKTLPDLMRFTALN